MRPRRFDTQLQFVFIVLSWLMVVVGAASFGVNRYLAQSQQQVLSDSIAIIERTERVAQDADFAASLSGQLAGARNRMQVADLSQALDGRVARIDSDLAAMREFLGRGPGRGSAEKVRALAAELNLAVNGLIAADTGLRAERDRLDEAGARLARLISTEADLARLRVTAGIWELYALPGQDEARAGLDRLADVNFFAFERLAEMAEAVATLAGVIDRITQAATITDLDSLGNTYATAVNLARDRARFMISGRSRDAATEAVGQLALGLGPEGMLAQRRRVLEAQAEAKTLSSAMDTQLSLLIDEARLGRDETRARMTEGVAAAGRQATALSVALAGVILLALLAGYLFWARTRRQVVLRLDEVADRMIAVAGGYFGQPMPISGQDEIGRMEQALNTLRDRAEEAAQLRGRLEAAVIDRTAEVVAEMRSANAARADAEEQSHAKTHFLARMSHEIRTPLNGLIGLLDLLAADEADATRRARLDVALTSARDLQAMTEDILAFSVGEDGQDRSPLLAFDPAALARGLGEQLTVIAAEKGLEPVIEIADPLPPALLGEPTKIRQVMVNLLSNAVKYTLRGRVVLSVSCRPAGQGRQELGLSVRDTGPGMTAEETRQAFDIYGRSRSARQSGIRGVGLGLAIVRQLTDAMGGELRVSTAPGQGSSFTLVLRLPETAANLIPAPAMLPARQAGGRVLVVDDHPVNRLVARGYLERMGYSVTEAETGTAAIESLSVGTFDAILLDLGLPDMPGETVLGRIDRKGAKVAILTADLVQDDAPTRQRFGADRVLTKPIQPRALETFLTDDRAAAEPSGAAEIAADLPATAPIDAILREDIAALGPDQTAQIVSMLLSDMAAAVADLRAQPDPGLRRKLAHRLKGAAANFRLDAFCALMQRLQSGDQTALEPLEAVAADAIRYLAAAARRAGLPVQDAAVGTKQ
jgi:two-component system sensor histidine kinase TorS